MKQRHNYYRRCKYGSNCSSSGILLGIYSRCIRLISFTEIMVTYMRLAGRHTTHHPIGSKVLLCVNRVVGTTPTNQPNVRFFCLPNKSHVCPIQRWCVVCSSLDNSLRSSLATKYKQKNSTKHYLIIYIYVCDDVVGHFARTLYA